MAPRQCPFCGADTNTDYCSSCKRDTRAPRRICSECGKMSPVAEEVCCHCGMEVKSDLSWKIPLIILMFVLAFVITFLLHFLGS